MYMRDNIICAFEPQRVEILLVGFRRRKRQRVMILAFGSRAVVTLEWRYIEERGRQPGRHTIIVPQEGGAALL